MDLSHWTDGLQKQVKVIWKSLLEIIGHLNQIMDDPIVNDDDSGVGNNNVAME